MDIWILEDEAAALSRNPETQLRLLGKMIPYPRRREDLKTINCGLWVNVLS